MVRNKKMEKLKAIVKLARPANILTAIADIIMGFSITGSAIYFSLNTFGFLHIENSESLLWLILATSFLYGGGVILNDFFDAELDKIERPERPIPSGIIKRSTVGMIGTAFLLSGMLFAFQVNDKSGFVAMAIGGLAVLYNSFSKHNAVLGPINMGLCRGLNLLLGVSAVPALLGSAWFIAAIPFIYITAITMVSRGEVNGGNRTVVGVAMGFYTLVILSILSLGVVFQFDYLQTAPFLILFVLSIFPPIIKAYRSLDPMDLRSSVKAGVISLIVMDATIAAGFGGWVYGLIILFLLPLSRYIARSFAVT